MNSNWHIQLRRVHRENAFIHGEQRLHEHTFLSYRLRTETDQFPFSFETLAEKLSNMPNLYFEMDGSFVWRPSKKATSSDTTSGTESTGLRSRRVLQIDGMVYDRNGAIEYIEMKGDFDHHLWDELLSVINSMIPPNPQDQSAWMIHHVPQGFWTTEPTFRSFFGT
jgi:hypothetical protein